MKINQIWPSLLLVSVPSLVFAQAGSQKGQFGQFVDANERFGRRLLKTVQETGPAKNVVISPLALSLAFAPLSETSASVSGQAIDEIRTAFGWTNLSGLELSTRMLLAGFDDEHVSISSSFYYRGQGNISDRFIERGAKYFGLDFKAFALDAPEQKILSQIPASSSPLRKTASLETDFWIVNSAHLRTVWAGNTFSLGTTKKDSFILASGQQEQVPMMVSEPEAYAHAKTRDFEAIALYGFDAYLLVVEPAPNKDIYELENELASGKLSPDAELKSEIGEVELPEFEFQFDSDMGPALEKLGIHQVFSDSGSLSAMVPKYGALLRGVVQRTNVAVNRAGIRANSTTVTNGIYGGICGNCGKPFHMLVDRPFVFLIRDRQTNSLLFIGSMFDPAAH